MSLNAAVMAGKDFSVFPRRPSAKRRLPSFRFIYETLSYLLFLGVKYCFLAIFSVACILAGTKVYTHIFQTDYFFVEDIAISGLVKLTEEEILSLPGVEFGKNTFQLNLENLSKSIIDNPWVASVMVRRELPKRLIIEITERKPFAKVLNQGIIFLIDDEGFIIAKIENHEYENLPIIGGMSIKNPDVEGPVYPKIFLTGLNLLKFTKETHLFDAPMAGLRIDSRNEMTLITQGRKMEVRVSTINLVAQLSKLEAIFDYAKMESKTIKSIDLCFKKKAIVKFSN